MRSSFPCAQNCRRHHCDFGKWYYGEGTERMGSEPIFQEVGRIHMQVHELARETVRLVGVGDQGGALAQFETFEEIRARLFEQLDSLYFGAEVDAFLKDARLFDWKDEYSVGVKVLDEDHKRLVALINRLYKATQAGETKSTVGNVLDELLDYTRTHFRREEELMRTHGYQGLPQQIQEHARLLEQLTGIREQFHAGDVSLSGEVLRFLKRWLMGHVLESDMGNKKFFNAKGVA